MIDALLTSTSERMQKAVDVTQHDLSSIRSGRANPALVEQIVVAAYGGAQKMKIMELATITTSDAQTIVIAPFDPSVKDEIAKGIMEANVGLTPSIDGEMIRISLPPLTQERREEFIKLARTKAEAGRVMIRQVRHEAMQKLKKAEEDKEISEDDKHAGEKKVQEATDSMNGKIDDLLSRKETELSSV